VLKHLAKLLLGRSRTPPTWREVLQHLTGCQTICENRMMVTMSSSTTSRL
jgi:hypothetical protein